MPVHILRVSYRDLTRKRARIIFHERYLPYIFAWAFVAGDAVCFAVVIHEDMRIAFFRRLGAFYEITELHSVPARVESAGRARELARIAAIENGNDIAFRLCGNGLCRAFQQIFALQSRHHAVKNRTCGIARICADIARFLIAAPYAADISAARISDKPAVGIGTGGSGFAGNRQYFCKGDIACRAARDDIFHEPRHYLGILGRNDFAAVLFLFEQDIAVFIENLRIGSCPRAFSACRKHRICRRHLAHGNADARSTESERSDSHIGKRAACGQFLALRQSRKPRLFAEVE